MFANLIESDSHRLEFKRRSSFFLITVAAYALVLFVAGIVSIYAYDARLEAQTSGLELLNWVPPVTRDTTPVHDNSRQPPRRSTPSSAPIDRTIRVAVRTEGVAQVDDPTKVPEHPGTQASPVPPVTGVFRHGNTNVDPPATLTSSNCATCTSNDTSSRVVIPETPPAIPPKPQTQRLATPVLISKAITLPQPPYPPLAKQIHQQGTVPVQILVDESGRVVSARAVSGHPLLTPAAEQAALRARFTPTILNGQAVKVQGVITYNFVLQ